LGGAIFGAILTNRLAYHLKQLLPSASVSHVSNLSANIQNGLSSATINKFPNSISHDIFEAFVLSFHDMFLLAVPVILVAFVVALFLREAPLRTTVKAPEAF
jgi:hypothetical protein